MEADGRVRRTLFSARDAASASTCQRLAFFQPHPFLPSHHIYLQQLRAGKNNSMSIPDVKDDAITDALEDGPSRYAAYAMRLRTVLISSSRYVAYSSGECFAAIDEELAWTSFDVAAG